MARHDIATLGITLEMPTDRAIADVRKFGAEAEKTLSRDVVAAAKTADAAINGMGDTSRAVAGVNNVGKAIRDAAKAAREYNQVERAGEALVAQLDRQISAYGKTASELRSIKAETAALNAERRGQIELAERIRAKEAALFDLEFAAARQAQQAADAAAQDRAEAAAAAEREAQAVRDAAAAHALFEAAVRKGVVALREEEAAAAAAAREINAQAVRDAAAAHAMFEARVRQGAAAMREADAAAARDAAMVERLREMLDPAAAAQNRLNREVEEARRVMIAAGFGAEELARAEALLVQRGAGVVGTTGNMKIGMQQMSFQLNDMATMWALQAKPMQIFASQAGQIIQSLQIMAGESKGFLALLGGPWGMAITTAAVVLVPLIGNLFDSSEAAKAAEKALDSFAKHQSDIGNFIDATTGRLIEQNRVLVRNAILTRQKAIDDNKEAITAGKDTAFAAAARAREGGWAGRIRNFLSMSGLGGLGAPEDQAINQVIRAANGDVLKLDAGLQALAKRRPDLKATVLEISNLAGSAVLAARDNERLGKEIASLEGKGVAGAKGMASLIEKQVALATATTAVEKAQAAYNLVRDRGAAAEKLGGSALEQYRRDLTAAATAVNAAEAAEKAQRQAAIQGRKDHAKAIRDEAKAKRESHQEDLEAARMIRDPLKVLQDATTIKVPTKTELPETFDVLDDWIGKVEKLNDRLRESASLLADAWGPMGDAIGRVTVAVAEYGKQQAIIDASSAKEAVKRQQSAQLQIGLYGDLAGAAKGFFDRGSAGYKALADAEKVFRAVQFAMSVRAIAQDFAETASSIANSAARTAAGAVEAVVNAIKSLPFPLNLAAGAATVGALASLGVSIAGSFGGSKGSLAAANDGTGTVLGDTSAKSDSLQRSIDLLGDLEHSTMVYSGQMLTALRSIDSKIGGFASLIARTGNVDASAGIDTGFKTDATGKALGYIAGGGVIGKLLKDVPIIGDILGGLSGIVKSLFGTKTKVVASGLYGDAQSLGEILAGGFDAQYFSDVEKKKKFFGVTTSTKVSTQYGAADPDLANQFTLILRSFADAVSASAGPLGIATSEIENRLNGFVVSIGKIDLQGLTGEQVQEKLEAVFGAAADSIAAAAIPGLERFQKVGEGYFETLIRVASTAEAVTDALDMLGQGARGLGLDAKLGLADLFDSVSDMQAGIGSYFETFYTDAEQIAARTAQLTRVFGGLGLTLPDTIAGYRALVDAQDLNTDAGRAAYAALIQLAPAFAEIATSAQDATSAAAIVRERQDLQKQLAEALGDTAAIRAAELARLDPSNRALQQQIWAIQDAQEAAKAADQLREAWKGVGDSIMDEVKRIRGLTDGAGGGSFASLLGQFNAANAAARGGDMDAAKNLPQLSKQLLDAAALAATSRQELDRVQGQTAATLEATFAALAGFGATGAMPATSTLADIAASQAASGTAAGGGESMADLRKEVTTLRTELVSALAQIAGNTGAIKRRLEDVTPDGDRVAVGQAA